MTVLAVIVAIIGSLAGVLLTFLTLPGIWIMLLLAIIAELMSPGLIGWWPLGFVGAVAIAAEIAEFFASAAGAGKAGGSRAGAAGSIVGSIAGLILGTPLIPIPIVGSIVGAVIGAGLGALAAELFIAKRPLNESMRSGGGALAGRALSIVIKGGFAVVAAVGLWVGLAL